jgi:hypothetical protein
MKNSAPMMEMLMRYWVPVWWAELEDVGTELEDVVEDM